MLFGLPASSFKSTFEEFLGRIHPEDRTRVRDTIEHAASALQEYQLEYRVVWPDSSIRWIAAKGHVYANSHGVAERTLGLLWDITGRKQAEIALSEQKELAEVTLSSIGDGVITTDASGRTQYLNRVAEQ